MANVYAVIMAGGVGARFWPKSRERSPKQLLEILGAQTMIQQTFVRINRLVPADNVFVVTNANQVEEIQRQLSGIPNQNVLIEPVGRNTAPCVGLAATWIHRADPGGIMIVLPSDHMIRDEDEFLRVLRTAISVAESGNVLVTIGINPTHPETGYGYIQYSDERDQFNEFHSAGVFRVKTFAEKPNLETAEKFLQSGDFLWNSGMFVWKAQSIIREIGEYLPELSEQLGAIRDAIGTTEYFETLRTAYGMMRSISIDYGVMEKSAYVYVVNGNFGWSDVGSWDEVVRLTAPDEKGNVHRGKVITKDSSYNYIDAGNRLVATIGVEDLIVVSTDDTVLICKKGRSQDVKDLVDYIRRKQMNEYL